MLKIPKNVLLGYVIFLVSCSSCKDFDWKPDPYVGDSTTTSLFNAEGEVIQCEQPEFDRMTCFDEANIAALKTAIEEVNGVKKKDKKKILKAIDKTFNNPGLQKLRLRTGLRLN